GGRDDCFDRQGRRRRAGPGRGGGEGRRAGDRGAGRDGRRAVGGVPLGPGGASAPPAGGRGGAGGDGAFGSGAGAGGDGVVGQRGGVGEARRGGRARDPRGTPGPRHALRRHGGCEVGEVARRGAGA